MGQESAQLFKSVVKPMHILIIDCIINSGHHDISSDINSGGDGGSGEDMLFASILIGCD